MNYHLYPSTCAFKSIEDIKDKHVTIMGLGLNGGGEAAVRFFLKHGAYVLATDMKSAEDLKPTLDSLENDKSLDKSRLSYRLGEHLIEDFENADCVIKNPIIKPDNNFLAAAKAIESDLSIFLRFTKAPIIAVTGSKGKSSTVSSIYYGLKSAGYKCFLGGNITVSPLSFFDQVNEDTPVIIEFSSWQLADLRGRKVLKPHISIITKIIPDHQNWYHSMEDYVADKRLIYADQTQGDYSIFDADGDEEGTGPVSGGSWGDLFAAESKASVLRYGKNDFRSDEKFHQYGVWQDKDENGNFCGKIFLPGMKEPEIILRELTVPGEHMKTNVLNAALVMYLMGVASEKIISICKSWGGIEHRLQYFHSWTCNSIKYNFYNDTCATVPEAAAMAIRAFEKDVILIAGGTDKELDFKPLVEELLVKKGRPEKLFLLNGDSTKNATAKLIPDLDKNGILYKGPFNNLEELLKAVKKDLEAETRDGGKALEKVVVFSPGATSFGLFKNEFDRGTKFMAAVKEIF
ncbi:MAG: UDP-N-acetylmuramoyl-L-alanine--D-glutamate ligase [Treponema sp.]|nr:UDP-N-acetylmuramoyl-L-alanine--D-glutamate ligase [Treponema sp.]